MRGAKKVLLWLAGVAVAAFCGAAQPGTQDRAALQRDLEALFAPVALYPDPLLSQLLQAATFPQEIAEAARWARGNPGLQGEPAVRAALRQPWDTSVRALTAFPLVLARMDEQPEWTRRAGQAFLAHEEEALESIQQLRARAYAIGQLRSGAELHVQRQGANILIDSASNGVVFVPNVSAAAYDPWPAAPSPVEWAPWPGYTRRPGGSAVSFGAPVPISRGLVYSGFDWANRHTHIASLRVQSPLASATPRVSPPEEPRAAAPEPVRVEPTPEPAQPAAPVAPVATAKPAPLVNLLPAPQPQRPEAQKQTSAVRSDTPEPSAVKPAPLVDLGRPPPVVRRELPAAAPVAKAPPQQEPAAASGGLISLMPSTLGAPQESAPVAQTQKSIDQPKPAPRIEIVRTAPAELPAAPAPPVEVARTVPVEPPAAPQAPAVSAAIAIPEPQPKTKVQEPIAANVSPEEALRPPVERPRLTQGDVAVEKMIEPAVPHATAAARPRRAFVSDADRRTLDAILGPSAGQNRAAFDRR